MISTATSAARTSGALIVRLLVQAGNVLVLAGLLGPERLGSFVSLAALAILMGTLATLGTHLTAMRDLAVGLAKREMVLSVALGTTLFFGCILLLVFSVVSALWVEGSSHFLIAIACIGAAELIFQPLLAISVAEKMSLGNVASSQLLRMLPLPIQLLAAASLWLGGVANPFGTYAVCYLASSIIALVVSLKLLPAPWPPMHQWRLLERAHWKRNGGFALSALTASGPTELDKAVAARLMPIDLAGTYAIASRIAIALTIPVSSLMLSLLPALFRDFHNRWPRSAKLNWIFVAGLAYGIFAATALWHLAPLLRGPFNHAFPDLPQGARLLALAIPGLCLRLTATNILLSMNRTWTRSGIESLGILLILGCSAALAPEWGIKGMCMSVVFAETAMALLGWSFIIRQCQKRGSEMLSTG
ncbi:MAG TPA: polysaccharide biosynthesis C-terminal domain-containing protein [Steroidobacteraceae bacterium]|nr:polysaccharide biosynthesis C-terminal domain-containing protein [Steroidobacteraceae bacterium]